MVATFSNYGEITKAPKVLVWNADGKSRIGKLRTRPRWEGSNEL
jgi:hypothetical protein